MECKTVVKLPGGFTYEVVVTRKRRECYSCGSEIPVGGVCVVERIRGVGSRTYCLQCFKKVMGYRMLVLETPSGVCISA